MIKEGTPPGLVVPVLRERNFWGNYSEKKPFDWMLVLVYCPFEPFPELFLVRLRHILRDVEMEYGPGAGEDGEKGRPEDLQGAAGVGRCDELGARGWKRAVGVNGIECVYIG